MTDPDHRLIDITPGLSGPPPDPRAARRRRGLALIVAAGVASVLTGAAGYAVLAGPPQRPAVVLPAVTAPVPPPPGGPLPGVPGADPVKRRPAPAGE